jgi:hypothetical protein
MFETLGINLVVTGMATVARDVSHVATSFGRFVNAVNKVETAALRSAQAQNKLATAMVDKTARAMTSLSSRIQSLQSRLASLNVTQTALAFSQAKNATVINSYNSKMSLLNTTYNQLSQAQQRLSTYHSNWTVKISKEKIIIKGLEDAIDKLEKELISLQPAYDRAVLSGMKLANTNDKISQTTDQLTEAQKELVVQQQQQQQNTQNQLNAYQNLSSVLGMVGVNTSGYQKMMNVLTGSIGGATGATAGFTKILGLTQPQLAAAALGLDLMKLGLNLVVGAAKLFIGAIKLVYNVLSKLVNVVWNVVKGVGTGLWNAFKKIISLPLKLITGSFDSFRGSLQRVFEMAIGMNLSRIWWGLGQKFRELAGNVFDAGVEFQVTFLRLRGLMTQEVLRSDDTLEYADALGIAGEQARELVTWVSKIGVQTIYDAEDILDITTLGMAYGFTSDEARKLTQSVLDFATGMGLEDVAMKRIIENFGQLRAQGKITGTELRDLARGSFVPVTDVLERMAERVGIIADYDIGSVESISAVFDEMKESGELTESGLEAIQNALAGVSEDGRITRDEFERVVTMFNVSSQSLQKNFGLTADQAKKAIEAIRTGELSDKLNEWIKKGGDLNEFFKAFQDIVTERFPNAAASAGATMKALVSNIGDYIRSMYGWRIVAPVLEVIAEKVQNFVTGTLMSESKIKLFDMIGLSLKNIAKVAVESFESFDNLFLLFKSSKLRTVAREIFDLFSFLGEDGAGAFMLRDRIDKISEFLKATTKINTSQLDKFQTGIWTIINAFWDTMYGRDREGALGEDWGFKTIVNAIKDIISPIWDEIIKPEIDRWWENIKIKMGEKLTDWWNNSFLPKLEEFGTEKLLPALETFFTETLPGWISTAKTMIDENGPAIINFLSFNLVNALTTLSDWVGTVFGEGSTVYLLTNFLSSLAEYQYIKIFRDGISDVSAANISGYSDAIGGLSEKLSGFLDPIRTVFEGDFGDKFAKFVDVTIALAGYAGSILELSYAVLNLGFAVAALYIPLSPGVPSGFTDFLNFLSGITMIKAGAINLVASSLKYLGEVFSGLKYIFTGELIGNKQTMTPEEYIEWLFPSKKDMENAVGQMGEGLGKTLGTVFSSSVSESIKGTSTGQELKNNFIDFFADPLGGLAPESTKIDFSSFVPLFSPSESDKQQVEQVFNGFLSESLKVDATSLANSGIGPAVVSAVTEDIKTAAASGADGKLNLEEILIKPENFEVDRIKRYGKNIVEGLRAGWSEELPTLVEEVGNTIPEIEEVIKAYFQMESPSQLMAEIGRNIVLGLQNGTEESFQELISWWGGAAQEITNSFNAGSVASAMYDAGRSIIQGLWEGLATEWEGLQSWWASVSAEIAAMFELINEIHSPSKLFMEYGKNIMKGLEIGLASGADDVKKAMRLGALDIQRASGAMLPVSSSSYNYSTVNTNNWNVGITTPIRASTTVQAYEILRMRAR